jgi:hypothetical protein
MGREQSWFEVRTSFFAFHASKMGYKAPEI